METEASDNGAEKIRDMQPVILLVFSGVLVWTLEENASNIMIVRLRIKNALKACPDRSEQNENENAFLRFLLDKTGEFWNALLVLVAGPKEPVPMQQWRELKYMQFTHFSFQPEMKTLV